MNDLNKKKYLKEENTRFFLPLTHTQKYHTYLILHEFQFYNYFFFTLFLIDLCNPIRVLPTTSSYIFFKNQKERDGTKF